MPYLMLFFIQLTSLCSFAEMIYLFFLLLLLEGEKKQGEIDTIREMNAVKSIDITMWYKVEICE